MSSLIVEVVNVDKLDVHPNADRLELATVKGWQCVVRKGEFKEKDKALYIPIDSVLPGELESKIFGPNSAVKLSKGRVKTIKLRKAVSQGLLIPLSLIGLNENLAVGLDLREKLGIVKYEPPEEHQSALAGGGTKKPNKKKDNPNFKKYTSLENVKNFPSIFQPGEEVSVTEKIHGTNFRAGYVLKDRFSMWEKIKKFFGFHVSNYEFVYGSHNVQLQNKKKSPFVEYANVYEEAVEKYRLRDMLTEGVVLYGEIYGSNIQKGYNYGCSEGERKAVFFDIMIDGVYLAPDAMFMALKNAGLPAVKELYRGPFDIDKIKGILKGNSVMVPSQPIIEGGVCKPLTPSPSLIGRKVLKFINDEYLLRNDTSDLH